MTQARGFCPSLQRRKLRLKEVRFVAQVVNGQIGTQVCGLRVLAYAIAMLSCILPASPPQRREWQPTPVFLPGESHGRRGLAGCSPWGLKESDTTEVT